MIRADYRKGFTLLEIMVACLLLGMLVTALTMVFNQSSIAWRSGMVGVVGLANVRSDLGKRHDNYDNLLPRLRDSDGDKIGYRAVSLWENGQLRTGRAFAEADVKLEMSQAEKAQPETISAKQQGGRVSFFTVGVRSAGPDGRFDTADDITTYPEDQ